MEGVHLLNVNTANIPKVSEGTQYLPVTLALSLKVCLNSTSRNSRQNALHYVIQELIKIHSGVAITEQ